MPFSAGAACAITGVSKDNSPHKIIFFIPNYHSTLVKHSSSVPETHEIALKGVLSDGSLDLSAANQDKRIHLRCGKGMQKISD